MVNEQIPITAFLVTKLLEQLPDVIENLAENLPIQFEIHSHSHLQNEPDSAREIETAVRTFESVLGYIPKGYRAPNGLISREGLSRLASSGFLYDSSVFPSIRFDEYGYNNLSFPVEPFIFLTPKPIIEFPLGVIPGIRLVISISYIKLLGFGAYKALIKALGLPRTVIILCHPYDFTIEHCLPNLKGGEKMAHARNASNVLNLLKRLVRQLKSLGYRFESMNEMANQIETGQLPEFDSSNL